MPPSRDPARELPGRLERRLTGRGLLRDGDRVLVALSGGMDSATLLHLLRFAVRRPVLTVVAAHVDHGMRPGSGEEAMWVRGLCRGWGVPLQVVRLDPAPATEAEARRLRYAALERFRVESGSDVVVTAHHADDQAETVLFRALRGAGPAGLRGIAERREPGVVRPLLAFGRRELQRYAVAVGLKALEDPSNRDARWTRNRIRHRLLPLAEEIVPGASRALARLARLSDEREEGWEALLALAEEGVLESRDEGRIVVARPPFVAYHSAVQTGLLRRWIRTLGGPPGEAATRLALDVASGPGGRRIALPGGVLLQREFDRLVILRAPGAEPPDLPLAIPDSEGGGGWCRVGGRRLRVEWGPERPEPPAGGWWERFPVSGLRFPLHLRGRLPGDRIRLAGGARKLKKVLQDARIPRWERHRLPVLVDREGALLWVPGVACAAGSGGAGGFLIGVVDADGA